MNIVVLAGGNSTEREVSISSGQGVCQALREKSQSCAGGCLFWKRHCGRGSIP